MSQFITLTSAASMAASYRTNKETILASAYQNQNILAVCETFDRSQIDDILAQSGCTGLRIYYGMDSNDKVHAILVGVDSNEADIIFPGTDDSLIAEQGKRCPTDCPPSSDLNS
jgi:hypothetical protein